MQQLLLLPQEEAAVPAMTNAGSGWSQQELRYPELTQAEPFPCHRKEAELVLCNLGTKETGEGQVSSKLPL